MLDFKYDDNELDNQLNKGALWAVTYGDLMSYLMLFFLLMFSFSLSEKGMSFVESLSEVQKAFGGQENKELMDRKAAVVKEEAVAEEIKKKFQGGNGASGKPALAQVEMTEEKIKITLREGILFDPGDVQVKDSAIQVLHEVAEFVHGMPNKIIIEGHTDNLPVPKGSKYVSNWVISMARAYKVLTYFTEVEKVSPERLACIGYGEFQPVADNSTPEGRMQNRRIEITLVRKQ